MRRFLLVFLLACSAVVPAEAQAVFDMVLESAMRVVNNPMSGYMQTQVAQFKRTALVYIKQKSFEQKAEVDAEFLDTQAYYLSEFLTRFFAQVVSDASLPEAARKAHIQIFMQASLANPLFGDEDHETVHAYVLDGSEVTPFSLDTDWERAHAFVASQEAQLR